MEQNKQSTDKPHIQSHRTAHTRKHWRRHRVSSRQCHCCRQVFPFCWHCRCGFDICQACMQENAWGMSCNGITWQCPDCGQINGLGNQ